MNVQLPVRMDKTAFLDWVQGREERYELDRGRVVMMTGGSRALWQITANLVKVLDARIDPQRWAVLPEFFRCSVIQIHWCGREDSNSRTIDGSPPLPI